MSVTVSGTLVDAFDTPIPSATIQFEPYLSTNNTAGQLIQGYEASGVSDANGAYSFTVGEGNYKLTVIINGIPTYMGKTTIDSTTPDPVDIVSLIAATGVTVSEAQSILNAALHHAAKSAASAASASESAASALLAAQSVNNLNEVSFGIAQAIRKEMFDRSGFVEWGKHIAIHPHVNDGINQIGDPVTTANKIRIGRSDSNATGDSKTGWPVANVNGVLHAMRSYGGEGTTWAQENLIAFPEAPTVTHADATNSGLVLNGDFSLGDNGDWALDASTTISGGVASVDGSQTTIVNAVNMVMSMPIDTYIVEYSISNYIGGQHRVSFNNSGAAEDDLKTGSGVFKVEIPYTSGTATGISITVDADFIGDIDFVSMIPKSSIERTDLVFLESWHEDTSEKGFVYPYGNIQYLGADTDGLTGIINGDFVGFETYSLFGNWQASSALIGKGYKLSNLTDAQLSAFVSNPDNNCYYSDDGKLIQVRYRVRTVEGLGDSWERINPQDADLQLAYSQSNRVLPKGKRVTISSEFTDGVNQFVSADYAPDIDKPSGIWQATSALNVADVGSAYEGQCYAMPIALIKRLNQGAYHPVYNERGCATWWTDDLVTSSTRVWYDSAVTNDLSTISCFGEYASLTRGQIGTSSGRPDDKFYDAIYAGQILDLRLSAYKDWSVVNTIQHLISGGARGAEGVISSKYIDCTVDTGIFDGANARAGLRFNIDGVEYTNIATTTNYFGLFYSPFEDANYVSGDTNKSLVFIVGGELCYLVFDSSHIFPKYHRFSDDARVTTLTGKTFQVLAPVKSSGINSGEMLHCDIIGDPANYYRGQTYTNTGATTSIDLVTGDVIWNRDGDDISGLDGHFYEYVGTGTTGTNIGNNNVDFTNTSNFTDLGSDWDGAGSWRESLENGYSLFGTPLLVGEEGEDYIPDGTYKDFKLSKKCNDWLISVYSDDFGATWSSIATGGRETGWEGASNTTTILEPIGRIELIFYTTYPETVEPAVNATVEDGEMQKAIAVNKNTVTDGNALVQSLINKVAVSTSDGTTVNTEGYMFDSAGELIGSPVHNTIDLATSNPAVKVLPYKTADGINVIFKELFHNGTSWGDDSTFDVVDNVTTTTDDNAETILIGQKSVKLKSDLR